MAHIVIKPPIQFINIDHPIGPNEENDADDILVIKSFFRYLQEHRPELQWTSLRLPTLTWPGSVDSTLFRMIVDYKTFKQNTENTGWSETSQTYLWLWPEERGNGRILPQNEMFPATLNTTIMALNSDVRPRRRLTWPGTPPSVESLIEILCAFYPGVRRALNGLPVREDMNWRDLARKRIPFSKWLLNQKLDAMRERSEAATRAGGRWVGDRWVETPEKERWEFRDADNELYRLQNDPLYIDEFKAFFAQQAQEAADRRTRQTETVLISSLNPSVERQNVTFTATVTMQETGAPVTQGTVTFDMIWGPDVHLLKPGLAIGGGSLIQLSRKPVVNGAATLTTDLIHKGLTRVKATFPDTGNLLGSSAEVPQQVN
jgi:hypothetical protein